MISYMQQITKVLVTAHWFFIYRFIFCLFIKIIIIFVYYQMIKIVFFQKLDKFNIMIYYVYTTLNVPPIPSTKFWSI